MIESVITESIQADERLARFVLFARWIRAQGSVKPDAFIPPADLSLSVTRHAELTETELWNRGKAVAAQRTAVLCGRADLLAEGVRTQASLDAIRAPLPDNPEHAHIVGWSKEKPAQKAAAQQLAAIAHYHPAPLPLPPTTK